MFDRVRELDFLGHRVSAAGASPLPAHVKAVDAFLPPTTVKELQQFLGLINFYRRFLEAANGRSAGFQAGRGRGGVVQRQGGGVCRG